MDNRENGVELYSDKERGIDAVSTPPLADGLGAKPSIQGESYVTEVHLQCLLTSQDRSTLSGGTRKLKIRKGP